MKKILKISMCLSFVVLGLMSSINGVSASEDVSPYPPLPEDISTYYVMALPADVKNYPYAWILTSPEPFPVTDKIKGVPSIVLQFGSYTPEGHYITGSFSYSLLKDKATGNLFWSKETNGAKVITMDYKPNFRNNFDIKDKDTDKVVFPLTPGIVPPVTGPVILGVGWWTAFTSLITRNAPMILVAVGLMMSLLFLVILVKRSAKSSM